MTSHQVSRLVSDPSDSSPCPSCMYHIGIGAIIAVLGFALMLTGALAAVGIVVLTLGLLYAVVAWVVSMMPSRPPTDAIP